ncbi:peptidoglycan-binding protein [Streptomyces sp. APSN-46.1]|nr:peptidoglycan-binding domain-containing protein [Streptomyces sp. APSN-46.1]MCJ1676282.1 peptidoglycan-binding protein [Streptomyces sp. APSN-46.1]
MSVTGVFGQETAQAVTAFQAEHQFTTDGIVGPDTWSALVNLT